MLRIAHRGARREHPENTLPAFARAMALGADGIELDVHCTADGEVVVHHDPVPRAEPEDPRLAGRPIASLTAAELATFEVAPGVRIPTLAEVLELVGDRLTLFVEIKGAGIAAEVARVLRGARTECAVHSFDHAQIEALIELAPEIPRGLLYDRPVADPAGALALHEARDLWPQWELVTPEMVAAVHEVGCRVITWTVNDPRAAAQLEELGVDGLCGDDIRIFDAP